jgi:hypothetical protein
MITFAIDTTEADTTDADTAEADTTDADTADTADATNTVFSADTAISTKLQLLCAADQQDVLVESALSGMPP